MAETPTTVVFEHDGEDTIYTFVTDDRTLYVHYSTGDGGNWADQGTPPRTTVGLSPKAVTAVRDEIRSQDDRAIHAIVTGWNDRLYQNVWYELENRWEWQDLGQPFNSNVSGIVAPVSYRRWTRRGSGSIPYDTVDTFVKTESGELYRMEHWSNGTEWHHHDRPNDIRELNRLDALVHHPPQTPSPRVYAFATTTEGRLVSNYSSDLARGADWDWEYLGSPKRGVLAVGSPDSISFQHQGRKAYVFVRGDDGHLYVCQWDGKSYNQFWHDLGTPSGTRVSTEPAVVTHFHDGSDRMYAFVGGADNRLHACFWDGRRWQWDDGSVSAEMPANAAVASGPSVVPFRYGDDARMYAFVRGSNDHLYVCYWDGVDEWLWRDEGAP